MKKSKNIIKTIDIETLLEDIKNNKEFIEFMNDNNFEDSKLFLNFLKDNYLKEIQKTKNLKKDFLYKEFKTIGLKNATDKWILIGLTSDNNVCFYDFKYKWLLTNYSLKELLLDLYTNMYKIVSFKV